MYRFRRMYLAVPGSLFVVSHPPVSLCLCRGQELGWSSVDAAVFDSLGGCWLVEPDVDVFFPAAGPGTRSGRSRVPGPGIHRSARPRGPASCAPRPDCPSGSPRLRAGRSLLARFEADLGSIPVRAGHSWPRWTMPGMCWVHPACAGRRLHAECVRGACGCSPARARWPLRAVSPP